MPRNLKKSIELEERARHSLAGGRSSSFRPQFPIPIFWERGQGSRLIDVDENEYIDYTLSSGPTLLGYSPQAVIQAVKTQLDQGLLYPGCHNREIQLSEMLCQIIPCADLVHYCNSGSEANHIAFRLARGYTGKQKIIKFEGLYHGWFDDHYLSVKPDLEKAGPRQAPKTLLQSKGQAENAADNVIILPWNDLEAFEKAVETWHQELAAAITVPVWYNFTIEPKEGFLQGLRDICSKRNIVLIFDEVISGFRTALGGGQEHYGVTPDLATFAKGIGAGLSLACLAGRNEIMGLIASGEVPHPGTYNGNPVCVAGGIAAVQELSKDSGTIYKKLYQMGDQLMTAARESAARWGLPVSVQGLGPGFTILFTEQDHLWDYRDYVQHHDADKAQQFSMELAERGVLSNSAAWFITTAHTEEDIQETVSVIDDAMKAIR